MNTTALYRGKRNYELSNHLGNFNGCWFCEARPYRHESRERSASGVNVVISDKRKSVCDEELGVEYFVAEVLSAVDYYPFGMLIPDRQWYSNSDTNSALYGFNGMRKDNEINGVGNALDFGARMYDSRLGRWFKTDSYFRLYASFSTYSFSVGNPINNIDRDGNTIVPHNDFSREQLNSHFGRLFNERTALLLTNNLSMDGQQKTISRKEFRQAIRGMGPEQKALARGYFQMINSENKALVCFGNSDDILPNEGFITEGAKQAEGLTFGELLNDKGGGATVNSDGSTNSEYTTAVFIQVDAKFSEFVVDVLDYDGNSGEWKDGKYSTFKEKGTYKDEVISHEILGHSLFGGFLKNKLGTENVLSIQVSNLVRKIMGVEKMRSGESDHKVNSIESEPGSGKNKPRSNVTETPGILK